MLVTFSTQIPYVTEQVTGYFTTAVVLRVEQFYVKKKSGDIKSKNKFSVILMMQHKLVMTTERGLGVGVGGYRRPSK
jgi:hypothetical protein